MNRSGLLLSAVAVIGCASTTFSAARTQPLLDVASHPSTALRTASVFVLSPATFERADPALGFSARTGLSTSTGSVTAAAERALFDAGWSPVSEPVSAALFTRHQVAVALRDLLGRGQVSFDEAALVVGRASASDTFLVVRGWRTSYGIQPAIDGPDFKVCPIVGELDMAAYDREGNVFWQGSATVHSTDLVDLVMTRRASRTTLNHPTFGCIARADCSECNGTSVSPVAPAASDALGHHAATALVKTFTGAFSAR